MSSAEIKQQLYDLCTRYVKQKRETLQEAIRAAQEAANDDTKSSAGDKHETGRAMAQLEQEKLSAQLLELDKMQQFLSRVPTHISDSISAGSVVITDHGNYYIAISAGKLVAGDVTYFAISPASPLGMAFYKPEHRNGFVFNNQEFSVKKVF